MKEKTNIFETFIRSIYDINSFAIFAKRGIKRAVMYILLLLIILCGIKSIFLGADYYNHISKISNVLEKKNYNIYIQNNQLSMDNSPIIFNDDKLTFYMDNEKTINDKIDIKDEFAYDDTSISVLKDGIVLENFDDRYIARYSTFFNGKVIDNIKMKSLIKNLKYIFIVSFFVINLINMFTNILLDYLIIVITASLISLFMKMIMKYEALWALTIYSSTLPLIIVTILQIIRPDVDFEVTFIIGTLTYLFLIFNNIKIEIIERFTKKKV